ncbi:MAG TPA: FHA domain-containing protein [Bdellovibrionota bacterium]|nr:FHA domain-containing protein [Bdellovibrionota bacterium]
MSQRAKIVVNRKGEPTRTLHFQDEVIYFGRSKKNEVVLRDSAVSRRHAKLFFQGNHLIVEDLGSSNGTMIAGKRIERTVVALGQSIEIGPFVVTVEAPDKIESTAPEATLNESTFPTASSEAETSAARPSSPTSPANDFMDAIDVRPGHMRVLEQFLEAEATAGEEPTTPEPTTPEKNLSEMESASPRPVDALAFKPAARLVRLDGPDAGNEILLDQDQVTIGSAVDCDVVIEQKNVSQVHATIQKEEDTFILKNQEESTGTFVDGVPIRERPLESHDIVYVGDAKFEFLEGTARSKAQRPRVMERSPTSVRPGATLIWRLNRLFSDWRIVALSSVLLGLLMVAVIPKPKPAPRVSAVPEAKSEPPESEAARVARFNVSRASELLKKKKYEDAEARLRLVLDKISPNDPEAIRLLDELEAARADEKRAEENRKRTVVEQAKKIQNILAEGDKLRAARKSAEARRVYEQALMIDSDSRQARASIEELNDQEESAKRERLARKKTNEQLKSLYNQGVMKFEAGDYGGAEQLLREVASKKGHTYQASAKKLLDEIRRRADKKIQDQVKEAKLLVDAGELLRAHSELQKITKQFPRKQDAARLLDQVEGAMLARAKQLFHEGIAYQELLEDPSAAVEKYQEVLRYSPDPGNELNRKALQRIHELEASGAAKSSPN